MNDIQAAVAAQNNALGDSKPYRYVPETSILAPLYAALAKAQAQFKPLVKNREVTVNTRDRGSYRFEYATLDNVLDCVREALAANELAIMQPFQNDADGHSSLSTVLVHSSGASITTTVHFTRPERIQELGSMLTYLRRYSLTALLGLNAEEDDDGNAADGNQREMKPRGTPQPPAKPTREQVKETADAAAKAEAFTSSISPGQTEPGTELMLTQETSKLIGKALNNLLSGPKAKLVSADIIRKCTGRQGADAAKLTEAEGQKIIEFVYAVAKEHSMDPDKELPEAQRAIMRDVFTKRCAV